MMIARMVLDFLTYSFLKGLADEPAVLGGVSRRLVAGSFFFKGWRAARAVAGLVPENGDEDGG